MSIKIGNTFQVGRDKCCYLSFKPLPETEGLIKLFKDDASFYPIKSINNKKDTFTVVTTKDLEFTKKE